MNDDKIYPFNNCHNCHCDSDSESLLFISSALSSLDTRLQAEQIKREDADKALDDKIKNLPNQDVNVDNLKQSLDAEISRATTEEAKLASDIQTEKTRAETAETGIIKQINDAKSELTVSINSETTRAENAETKLTDEITELKTNAVKQSSLDELDTKLTTSINNIEDELTFTKETGTTVELGGIKKGTTFSGRKLIDIINDMLYPYVAFNITGLSLSPNNGGTFEKGSSITITGSITWLSLGSEPIVKVSIFDGDTKLGEKTEGLTGNNISIPINLTISDYKTLKTEVEDKHGTKLCRNSGSFNFVYPFYYGSLATGVYDAESVKNLTKVVEGKWNKKFSYAHSDKCALIAYPASYGNLKSIFDPNNFDITGTFTKHEVAIVGLDKKEVNYFVYVNSPSTLDNFAISFNF